MISNNAWDVLAQLAKGAVWDGDLIDKAGRTELIKAGLAKRDRQDDRGLLMNELTPAGLKLAAQFQGDNLHRRH